MSGTLHATIDDGICTLTIEKQRETKCSLAVDPSLD